MIASFVTQSEYHRLYTRKLSTRVLNIASEDFSSTDLDKGHINEIEKLFATRNAWRLKDKKDRVTQRLISVENLIKTHGKVQEAVEHDIPKPVY